MDGGGNRTGVELMEWTGLDWTGLWCGGRGGRECDGR